MAPHLPCVSSGISVQYYHTATILAKGKPKHNYQIHHSSSSSYAVHHIAIGNRVHLIPLPNSEKSKCLFGDSNGNYVGINVYWIIIPGALNGFSLYIFFLAGIEFICAQAPFNMKGIIFGLMYTLYGLGTLIQSMLSIPFLTKQQWAQWERAPLTCDHRCLQAWAYQGNARVVDASLASNFTKIGYSIKDKVQWMNCHARAQDNFYRRQCM